jgi:hypothetical protein
VDSVDILWISALSLPHRLLEKINEEKKSTKTAKPVWRICEFSLFLYLTATGHESLPTIREVRDLDALRRRKKWIEKKETRESYQGERFISYNVFTSARDSWIDR